MMYYRIQHMKDPTSYEWCSQIGCDDDELGTEAGTSCCETFEQLQKWARGGHANWLGELAVVVMEGELLSRGTDGECIIRPTREVRRIPFHGGRGEQKVSVVIQHMQL